MDSTKIKLFLSIREEGLATYEKS